MLRKKVNAITELKDHSYGISHHHLIWNFIRHLGWNHILNIMSIISEENSLFRVCDFIPKWFVCMFQLNSPCESIRNPECLINFRVSLAFYAIKELMLYNIHCWNIVSACVHSINGIDIVRNVGYIGPSVERESIKITMKIITLKLSW